MLAHFQIRCDQCKRSFAYDDIQYHQQQCNLTNCSNQLCYSKLQRAIRFQYNGVDYVACSQKCEKVTKFSLTLTCQDENMILKAYQEMLMDRKEQVQSNSNQF
jgi:hypothetical protein